MTRRPAARRALWTVTDQVLSSITNFAATFVVARLLSAANFGAYAVAYATYVLILTLSQATASEPLVIRYSAASRTSLSEGARRSTGQALVNGIVGGVAVLIAAHFIGGPVGSALTVLSLLLPGLLLQDCWRFTFFASGNPRGAAVNDGIWCIGQAVAFAIILLETAHPSVGLVMIGWGSGACFAAVGGAIQSRLLPSVFSFRHWIRDQRDLAGALTVDGLMMNGGQQLASYLVAATSGLADIAGFRGVLTLFGPVSVAYMSSRIFCIPEGVRLRQRNYRRLPRAWIQLVLLLLCVGVAAGIVALLLPDRIGRALLGTSWAHTRPLIPAFTALLLTRAIQTSTMIGLRVLDAPKEIVKARTQSAPIMIVGGTAGSLLDGALGAVIGLMVGSAVGAWIWWRQLVSTYRARAPMAGGGNGIEARALYSGRHRLVTEVPFSTDD